MEKLAEQTSEERRQNLMRKIKGLLAKGNGTDNLHEKSVFTAQAHKLMAENNIFELAESADKVFETAVSENTQSVSILRKTLAQALVKHYGCAFYYQTKTLWDDKEGKARKVQRMIFVGNRFTVETLILTFDFVWNSFIKASDLFLKNECSHFPRSDKAKAKQDYLVGFADGVTNELIKSINKYGLTVSVPAEVTSHIMKICTGTVTTKSLANAVTNGGAVKKGYDDGSFAMQKQHEVID